MLLSWIAWSLFFLLFSASPSFGFGQSDLQNNLEPCGTVVTDDDIAETTQMLSKIVWRRQTHRRTHTFNVQFHIIAANFTEEGGWVPAQQIRAQIAMMNDRYDGTGISWNLAGVRRVLNKDWHEKVNAGMPQAQYMHRYFYTGGRRTMNVYTVGFYGLGINGYSTLPNQVRTSPFNDGVVMLHTTMPGGQSRNRQGGTLIHEAGHWLGLRHVFQGGCTGAGDGVDDTPPAAGPNYYCPIGRRSCDGDTLDPIHNYMDYTDESCRNEFTPGQIDLMHQMILTFRQ